ncbi:sugar kinase [Streptomyces sp. NPDC048567]|uniref:sugar kinase n=1 Tax=Streptomyces sp. NPDC048567 TaxID=3365570 RepID=UPI00371247F8
MSDIALPWPPTRLDGAVVCVGETMAQVVPSDGQRLHEAAQYAIGPAGAESNVAISLARLGTHAAWAGLIGNDPLGIRLRRDVERYGVSTDLVRAMPGERTGVFVKDPAPGGSEVYYYRFGSASTLMDDRFAEAVMASGPGWVHLTGVTPALSSSCAQAVRRIVAMAHDASVPVSFDANHRPPLWPDTDTAAHVIGEIAASCDVVFVGRDEAEALWGTRTADAVREHLPQPGVLVVKDGSVECVSFDREGRTVVPALPVEVVEPVGAGDAFAAGWIHARLHGMEAAGCLRLGHLMAGFALTSHSDVGDLDTDPALLVARAADSRDWPTSAPLTAARPLR